MHEEIPYVPLKKMWQPCQRKLDLPGQIFCACSYAWGWIWKNPLWLSQSLLLNISIGIVYNVQTVLTCIVRH